MDYAEVREAFFQLREPGAPEPGTPGWQSPTWRLRDAIEPIATICYWSEPSARPARPRAVGGAAGLIPA